jgi:hypothetical protein
MRPKLSWFGWCMCLVAVHAFGQTQATAPCASPRQHAVDEARARAFTQGMDGPRISNDYAAADSQRLQALATIRRCQTSKTTEARCSRELQMYTIADQQYQYAAQSLNTYKTAASAQARVRAGELPLCR